MQAVMLPPGIKRGLRPAATERSSRFLARYESSVLFYDVYWSADGRSIILQGPPPIDLHAHYRDARYVCLPSGKAVKARAFHSYLACVFALDAPAGTTHLDVTFAGHTQRVPIGHNHSSFFSGTDLLFTLSKDNDLDWIVDWARFHQVNQGANAILLFDNMSTRYSTTDIGTALGSVAGIARVGVVPVPFAYPLEDEAVPEHAFWAHFLQPSVIINMFRRYGMASAGILNVDIDELAVPLADESVFAAARKSRSGTVYFRGCWIEPASTAPSAETPRRHKHFSRRLPDADFRRGGTQKWALTPNRRWLQNLKIHPYPHAVQNRPMLTRHKQGTAFIAHYKAISTGWKYDRSAIAVDAAGLVEIPELAAALERAFPDKT